MSVELVAVKPLKYRHKHIDPGQSFRVKSEREARVFVHLKKTERTRNENRFIALDDARGAVDMPPLSALTDDINAVRAEYQRIVGRRPFTGWSIETLRERMKAAQ